MKPVNVAVVGATGAVGEVMIEILESRDSRSIPCIRWPPADPPASPYSFAASITRCRISAPLIFPRHRLDCFQRWRYQRRICADCSLGRMRCDRQHLSFSPRRRHPPRDS